MVIGKNYKSASDLGKLFINKKVSKSYYALLDGIMSDKSIIINSPLIKSKVIHQIKSQCIRKVNIPQLKLV